MLQILSPEFIKDKKHFEAWRRNRQTLCSLLGLVTRKVGEEKVFWWVTPNSLTMALRRAREKAGIQDLRLHDLRHCFAMTLRQRGTGLDVIQDLLGHSDPRQTRRYAHLGESQLVGAVRLIEGVFSSDHGTPLGIPTSENPG